jgi:uncharacterized damage-inducible protein DinB
LGKLKTKLAMEIIPMLLKEMAEEARTTRTMLSRIPDDRYDWQPHHKSMTIRQLGVHIAELPSWVAMVLHTDGIDFGVMEHTPTPVGNTAELLTIFERCYTDGEAALRQATEADLLPLFTLHDGDTIFSTDTKAETIRMAFAQTIHHRAQLGVYLRLLDVPIPGSYGPSADEPWL